jgi:hypothetical protein
MAMYVVQARVATASARPVARTRAFDARIPSSADDHAGAAVDLVAIDLVGGPAGGRLAERMERWRVLWAQTTFYLFDADGWR